MALMLDPEQQRVVDAVSGPVCVLAGAGTGKTRAITHRIANAVAVGAHDPSQTLALTFTSRAAGEMRVRLRELGVSVQARTFHAAALRQLRYFWPRLSNGPMPTLLSRKSEVVSEAMSQHGIRPERTLVLDVASHIEWAKVGLISADEFANSDRELPQGVTADKLAAIYRSYERTKAERSLIDFEDVLLVMLGALSEYDEIATQVRNQYRFFTVDEYQDVSPLQQQLLEAWLGDSREICVVGDPNQTIYSFAGATPKFLHGFTQKYPEAQTVSLFRDYRSTPEIVDLANRVIGGGSLRGQRPKGAIPKQLSFRSNQEEAQWIADDIEKLLGKVASNEIAILFRTNGQSENYEAALANRGISYQVRGSERFFERPEIRDAMRLLRAAAIASTETALEETRAILTQLGWTPTAPNGSGAVRERWDSLNALVDLAAEFESLTAFVDELEDRAAHQHAPTLAGVTLASLHAAKGLEWDVVYLAGVKDGMVPISYATSDEALEEERRLLYVGITRAREQLTLSWAGERSRFLAPQEKRSAFAPDQARTPAHCHRCGKALTTGPERKIGRCSTCPSTADQGLVDRLKAWRLAEANAASMPAFVIFTDATLMAIAERQPASLAELSAIPGVGPAKLERYGQALLALLAQ